jgi:hypothetical protein
MAILNAYPLPTVGYQNGANNALITSPNPQDQRKDDIRFDFHPNNTNQFTFRYSHYDWTAVDAFRGNLPYARTSWDRPNSTLTASWQKTIGNNLINEASFTYSHDYVYINLYTADGAYQRSRYGINYPYIFQEKAARASPLPTPRSGCSPATPNWASATSRRGDRSRRTRSSRIR